MLKRWRPISEEKTIIPDHQFRCRQQNSTSEQVHRITEIVRGILEIKAVLLCGIVNVTQATDKACKPQNIRIVLKTETKTRDHKFKKNRRRCIAGTRLISYLHKWPTDFADGTAVLATHEGPGIAPIKLRHINEINEWAKKWRTKVNQNKPRVFHSPAQRSLSDSAHAQCCCSTTEGDTKWNTWACISIEEWHGQTTSEPRETSSIYKRNKCTGYSVEGQHYQQKANWTTFSLCGMHPVVSYLRKDITWDSRTTNNEKEIK
jgi:hypothetical protein